MCCIFQGVGFRKLSSGESDLEGPCRSLTVAPFDRSDIRFPSIVYASILYCLRCVVKRCNYNSQCTKKDEVRRLELTHVAAADGQWFAEDDPRDCLVAGRRRERSAVRPVACQVTCNKRRNNSVFRQFTAKFQQICSNNGKQKRS